MLHRDRPLLVIRESPARSEGVCPADRPRALRNWSTRRSAAARVWVVNLSSTPALAPLAAYEVLRRLQRGQALPCQIVVQAVRSNPDHILAIAQLAAVADASPSVRRFLRSVPDFSRPTCLRRHGTRGSFLYAPNSGERLSRVLDSSRSDRVAWLLLARAADEYFAVRVPSRAFAESFLRLRSPSSRAIQQ